MRVLVVREVNRDWGVLIGGGLLAAVFKAFSKLHGMKLIKTDCLCATFIYRGLLSKLDSFVTVCEDIL